MKIKPCSIFVICVLVFLSGCGKKDNSMESREGTYFDTAISIGVYSEDSKKVLDGSFELCEELENTFSRTKKSSELYKVNHRTANQVEISNDLAKVIQEGIRFYKITDGKFDITIEPLLELWDFKNGSKIIPEQEKIDEALLKVDGSSIQLSGNILSFKRADTKIDLGALAKGYAADKLKEYLNTHGVKSAMINLGGNVLAVGAKPDGSPWNVGIQKPFAAQGETADVLQVRDQSVVSSGIYERYFKKDGKIYHHILDSDTGYPADTEDSQVTIVGKSSLLGDALSTVCILMGEERSKEIVSQFPEATLYPIANE